MKLVRAERNGEAFDSQLVIGVRESYVNLCSNPKDRMQIYRENFEAAYIQSTEMFYRVKAPEQLAANGVQAYMRYSSVPEFTLQIHGNLKIKNDVKIRCVPHEHLSVCKLLTCFYIGHLS